MASFAYSATFPTFFLETSTVSGKIPCISLRELPVSKLHKHWKVKPLYLNNRFMNAVHWQRKIRNFPVHSSASLETKLCVPENEAFQVEITSNQDPLTSVSIYDTTLRDGSQMVGISLSVSDKLKIAKILVDLGVGYIEGGWPGSNPKDEEFFARWPKEVLAKNGTKLAAFGSTRYKFTTCEKDANVQKLLESNAEVITLVAKAWDAQVERVLEAPLDENLKMIHDSVKYFKERGREVMLDAEHFYDGYVANPEYAMECLRAAATAGADVVVLCDTNGGSMPWHVEAVTRSVQLALSRWPQLRLGCHCHNDCELAVANSLAATRGGASLVQGTVNGYGERTGNANLVSIIGTLQAKMDVACIPAPSLRHLAAASLAVAELAHQPANPAQPFVGSSAFAHKGGIHVAALRKMPESYNHMDPTLVGNAMSSVVSELSGRGNILDKMEKSGLVMDREVAGSVLARIKKMESEGCAFEGASASVDMLIVRRGKEYKQPFKVVEFSVISSNREVLNSWKTREEEEEELGRGRRRSQKEEEEEEERKNLSNNQAIVKVQVEGRNEMSAAEGNGPVDALSHALRAALEAHYPQLRSVELKDYRVRLVEPTERRLGTMSTTRVTIDFVDQEGNTWTTVGAHSSIVEASFRALVDGLEFGIANCSEEAGCVIR